MTLLKLKPKKTDFGDKQATAELSLVLQLKKKKTRCHFSRYRRVILVDWLNSVWSVIGEIWLDIQSGKWTRLRAWSEPQSNREAKKNLGPRKMAKKKGSKKSNIAPVDANTLIVAAEFFWKFPEWKISGNFQHHFFHFLTGYWKFILLIISRPKCHRIIF